MKNKFIRMLAVLACLVCCVVMMQLVASAGDVTIKVEKLSLDPYGYQIMPTVSGETVTALEITNPYNCNNPSYLGIKIGQDDSGKDIYAKVVQITITDGTTENEGKNDVRGGIYTLKITTNKGVYERKVNLQIKNCYLITNNDMLVKDITAANNAKAAVTSSASTLPVLVSDTTANGDVYSSIAAYNALEKAIASATNVKESTTSKQAAIDSAQQALYFARRNFVWGIDYSMLYRDSSDWNKLHINQPSSEMSGDIDVGAKLTSLKYASGFYPDTIAFGKDSSSKMSVLVDPKLNNQVITSETTGVYSFVGTVTVGGMSMNLLKIAVICENGKDDQEDQEKEIATITEALKAQFNYIPDSKNAKDNLPHINDDKIAEIIGSTDDFNLAECVARAQAYYTEYQRASHPTGGNLEQPVVTEAKPFVEIIATNAYRAHVSMKDANNKLVVDTELSVNSAKSTIAPFYPPKAGTYTVTVIFWDGTSATKEFTVTKCASPIELVYSSGKGISIIALSGVSIEHIYYTYGTVSENNYGRDVDAGTTNLISVDGKSSVPALGKGTHTFYIKAKFYGTVVDGFYEIDVNDDSIGPVVTVINGTVGVFHYSLGSKNDVKSIAYAKGDYSNWTTMSGAEDLTFVPTGNVTLSMAGFEQSEYTFCFITNDGTTKFVLVAINPNQANT